MRVAGRSRRSVSSGRGATAGGFPKRYVRNTLMPAKAPNMPAPSRKSQTLVNRIVRKTSL